MAAARCVVDSDIVDLVVGRMKNAPLIRRAIDWSARRGCMENQYRALTFRLQAPEPRRGCWRTA